MAKGADFWVSPALCVWNEYVFGVFYASVKITENLTKPLNFVKLEQDNERGRVNGQIGRKIGEGYPRIR